MTAERWDEFFNYWFGDEAEAFKEQCQDIFAQPIFARTEALEEELEELQEPSLSWLSGQRA